uniref:Vitronectin n=1 Tax=Homo sapiens TaxID=9606 RepID=UPI00122C1304|nr:Chain A, Vitronectin [Homo sapiens]6O5E_B Chain B, Vitronectin [Homo sapiens]7RJ9_A Chain A, Vitronectin [Homo sapiens]7RJ9_B Chain B, Vitronectin [Homo sapiens]7TXR_A Chain A, Vitronectin [Homo sapiens]7TXR_B Chain B, Vitronectin [Homo sapiens]7U68_A Chain A, vitronectin [Homo sapiens]7U68_B Chain B, vitronectin [Homo sapiens]
MELCSGKPFDAFTDLKNGSLFAFRGQYSYELDEKAVRPGYPKLIRDVWGIEGPIDAAFTRINSQGKTYLFKGSQYWRFEDGVLDPDYPRNISDGFDGIPDNVDAALALPAHSYSGRERVYFFKGKQYWEYQFQRTSAGTRQPQFISRDWHGVPGQVDAAMAGRISVFFFSGDKYYRVNLRTRRVDTVDPPYPRSIAQYWLGCPA